jgi:hypothetical protein
MGPPGSPGAWHDGVPTVLEPVGDATRPFLRKVPPPLGRRLGRTEMAAPVIVPVLLIGLLLALLIFSRVGAGLDQRHRPLGVVLHVRIVEQRLAAGIGVRAAACPGRGCAGCRRRCTP